jgi:3-oxoacyl-[acyl-carrier protein] reductase
MDMELCGKKVLITGGSKGIGFACAQGFAADGAMVHIASRNERDLKAAADALAKQHKAAVTIHPMDLRKKENAVALGKLCGDVDILVNNAGGASLLARA